jgi:hypothetical protein
MKTALILSGHLRTFRRCWPTIRWHVLGQFPEADVFVSTIRDPDIASLEIIGDEATLIDVVPSQPDCVALLCERMGITDTELARYADHAPYALSVPIQAVLAQLWQLSHAWDSVPGIEDYDVVIRCRPDLFFHELNLGKFQHPGRDQAWTPFWGRFGGVNDRFAIMGALAAKAYFTTWRHIPELLAAGCPLHPESLVAASIMRHAEALISLDATFSKIDHEGRLVRPWLQECFPHDPTNLR